MPSIRSISFIKRIVLVTLRCVFSVQFSSQWGGSCRHRLAMSNKGNKPYWYPDNAASYIATRRNETISLDGEPLLPQRQQILEITEAQVTSSQRLKQKYRATGKSRQEHWEASETVRKRKMKQMQKERVRREYVAQKL